MSNKMDSKGASKKTGDKKPSDKKTSDKKADGRKVNNTKIDKKTGDKKMSDKKDNNKKANNKMEKAKKVDAKKNNTKVDDDETYLSIPAPSEPAESLKSDIFNISELSCGVKPRPKQDNTPSWALSNFQTEDKRLAADKNREAREYIDKFQGQHGMSDKLHSFVMGIVRAAVELRVDMALLDLLQTKIELSLGERKGQVFVCFGIKCPTDIQVDYKEICRLTETIFEDVYAEPENRYLPGKVGFAIWKRTDCPVDPDDPSTTFELFGATALSSDDERYCVDLTGDLMECLGPREKEAIPLHELFGSHMTLYESENHWRETRLT